MTDEKLNEFKKWFENKGYDFEDELWMEDYIIDHKFRDIIQLMDDYHNEQQHSTQANKPLENKALNIVNVSGDADDFEKDLGKLITDYVKIGLKKIDLVKKMEWMTGNCKFS